MPSAKVTPKAEETGLKILEAALTLFREEGFDKATMRDIAAKAGVATDENGMGSVVRDLNGDGKPDWFVTSISMRTKSGGRGITRGCAL